MRRSNLLKNYNNPAVWDVSSPSYKDTNLKQKLMAQIAEKLKLLDESIVHASSKSASFANASCSFSGV